MMTISNYLKGYYALWHPTMASTTLDCYTYSVRSVDRFLKRPAILADFNEGIMLQWLLWRIDRVARKTACRDRATLLMLWKHAVAKGYVSTKPELPEVPVPKKLPVAYRVDDIAKLLDVCGQFTRPHRGLLVTRGDWWRAYYLALYDTGARPTALLRIGAHDIDWNQHTLLLRAELAKTHIDQVVGLSEHTIAAMRGLGSDPPFLWKYRRDTLWEQHREHLRRAGLPVDRAHSLCCFRRTHATLVARHSTAEQAARSLGHTSVSTTLKYYIDPRGLGQESPVSLLPRPESIIQ